MTNTLQAALLLLVLTLTMTFATAEAKTIPNPVVETNVPFAFQIGNRVLPAGKYSFEVATGSPRATDTMSVLIVRNREANIYQAIAVPVNANAGSGLETRAVFSDNDQHVLVAVWERGFLLTLQPRLLNAAENSDEWLAAPRMVSLVSQTVAQ